MSLHRINAVALEAARNRPIIVANDKWFTGLLDWLTGAKSAGTNAANQTGSYYQNALNNVINATGSPAATTFGNLETAALQPQFNKQNQALAAREAAMGITGSGASKADFTDLASNQSATLAGAIAPLYSSALSSYEGINSAMPGAQSGAYNTAYQNAINNFYAGLSDVGSIVAGAPPMAKPAQAGGYYPAPTIQPGQIYQDDPTAGLPPDLTNSPDYNPYAQLPPPPSPSPAAFFSGAGWP